MWRVCALTLLVGCGSSPSTKTTTPHEEARDSPERNALPAGHDEPVTKGAPVKLPAGSAGPNRCDAAPVGELTIDGLLDDWNEKHMFAAVGNAADGAIELRCVWDGNGIAFAIDVKDDRLIRVKGGQEDHVSLSLAAGGKPVLVDVYPGNSLGKPKHVKPAKVASADSLQPKGFSVEVAIPANAIPEFSPSTPHLTLRLVFHDSDAATGGDTTPVEIATKIELGDRKDLLEDFLATVRLRRADVKLDMLVDLDPDRRGKERLVAGGTVIGVLTDQFAFVTLPAASPADVKKIELLPLGKGGLQVVSAIVRQTGNGGARELLMMWTVWSGQLQPLVNIEVRKELGANVLESTWKIVKGKKAPELVVEPKPAVGFTQQTYNEVPAGDADPILVPWDETRAGIAYTLKGAEIERRDIPGAKPAAKKKKK